MTEKTPIRLLSQRLALATQTYKGKLLKHIKSGQIYQIKDASYREYDMLIVLHYSPIGEFFDTVTFNRPLYELLDDRKFTTENIKDYHDPAQ